MSAVSPSLVDFRPPPSARFLLLQMRNPADPMRTHEVRCFARSLKVGEKQITTFDLLQAELTPRALAACDMALLGGAGEFSAAGSGDWLDRALESLRVVYAAARPTFASCWGFQAFARALGGHVVNDVANAEVGTLPVSLSSDGTADELFGQLPPEFMAPMGHEDHVMQLPPDAVQLARSARVAHQAFRFRNRPIYCTQFHPELDSVDLVTRVKAYPEYLERIAGVSLAEFRSGLRPTPDCSSLLQRFAAIVFA